MDCIVSKMRRSLQILALILLALMVPASVCCLVPQASENQSSDCCALPAQNHDAPAQQDACPSTTIAHSQLPTVEAMPDMMLVEVCDIFSASSLLRELTAQAEAPLFLPTNAPPELPMTWAFVSRAALPARAPSELA